MKYSAIASLLGCLALAASCTPEQINSAATLNCALAADGATVVAIAKPGAAGLASAGAKVGCAAGTQIGQAVITAKTQ